MLKWCIFSLQTPSILLHNTVIDGLEVCGLLEDHCIILLTCLKSHSDGTHSLQRIHWWVSDVISLQMSPNLFQWRNKLINKQQICIFGQTIPLMKLVVFNWFYIQVTKLQMYLCQIIIEFDVQPLTSSAKGKGSYLFLLLTIMWLITLYYLHFTSPPMLPC